MKETFKNEKAITLVTLIITIIVLLILAMVSIRLVMNGGIIGRAERGTQTYKESEIQEQIKLAYAEWQTAQWTSDAGDAATFIQGRLRTALNDNGLTVTGENGTFTVEFSNGKTYAYNILTGQTGKVKTIAEYPVATPGTATTENSKYTSNGKTAVIPAGYTVDEEQNSIDNGLVISKDGNEWVWIPVSNEDFALMFAKDNTGWALCGTSGDNTVVTQYKSNARTDVSSDLTRTTPGDTSGYREPDTLGVLPSCFGGEETDKLEANWTAAGFSSFNDMAIKLKDDYRNMLDSVRKNGGFYVGRYELSSVGTKKGQDVLSNTNWYTMYKKCKDIDSNGVETRMIWGCQWDQICKFISTSGDQVSLTDSTSYGNYCDSSGNAAVVVDGEYQFGNIHVTGYSEYWKVNNIYDLAGNCWEWTQEANLDSYRAYRSGDCYFNECDPVTYRGYLYPTGTDFRLTSRPALYIK